MTHSARSPSYLVITPVHNEEDFVEGVLRSMSRQTVLPARWVIANDASDDATCEIVLSYAEEMPFLELLEVPQPTGVLPCDRLTWAAEARAFNYGLASADDVIADVIVKLDADLSFSSDFFEGLLRHFADDPLLGIAGGLLHQMHGARLVAERGPRAHVRGATKAYRRACFREIRGMEECLGWDTIDELRAQMHGWKTESFDDLEVVHHRPTSSVGGRLRGAMRLGRGSHYLGYDPLFMLARCLRRTAVPPYVIGGLAMLAGYAGSWLRRDQQIDDPDLVRYLRAEQRRRLLLPSVGDEGSRAIEGFESEDDRV